MENSNSSSNNMTALSSFDSINSDNDSFPKFRNYPSFSWFKPAKPLHFSFFSSEKEDGSHHFLDSCHFCKKPIGHGCDIFMYRGNMPFCSEECRQEQIDIDEAEEKRMNSIVKRQQQIQSSNGNTNISDSFQIVVSGTVVAS